MAMQLPGEPPADPPLLDAPIAPEPVAPQYAPDPPSAPSAAEPPPKPNLNFFDQFDAEEDAGEVGLLERARLNAVDSYYRGDPTGAGYLRNLSLMMVDPKKNPEFKGKDPAREEYESIITDLARYDMLQPWGSTMEAASAFGGQLWGGVTPAALLRVPLGLRWGAGAAGRIAEGAAQGAITNTLLDPATQVAAVEAGALKEFDWTRTALAGPIGAVVGGGMVGAGQAITAGVARMTRAQLAAEDPSLRVPGDEAPPEPKAETGEPTPEPVVTEPATPEARADVTTPEAAPGNVTEIPAADVTTRPAEQPAPEVEATRQAATQAAETAPERLPEFNQAADTVANPGEPAGVFQFDAGALATDAKRFQYKEGGDTEGVTTALKGITKWDAAKANQIIVWQDASGKLWVADGHQRSGLARRLLTEGKAQEIKIPGLLYREADGFTAEDVRAIAAAKNISEGSGSPIDGAKVLRSRPELLDGSISMSRTESRQSVELARLDEESFGMVVNEVVPYQHAAVVGRYIPDDPARQLAAMKALARFEPRNEIEATVLVQRVAQAELAKAEEGAQGSMFDFTSADTTAGEEMRIVARVIADLKKDKTLFSRVVSNAGRIEEVTGSSIEREAAQSVAQDAEIFARAITSGAYSPGPLRDALVKAAREVRDGSKTVNDAARDVLAAARGAVENDVPSGTGDRASAGRSEDEGETLFAIRTVKRIQKQGASLFDQREAEGQARIPGLEPSTIKEKLDLEAQRPLSGGDAAPGGLFGPDVGKQKDLFALKATPDAEALTRRSGGTLAAERTRSPQGVPDTATTTGTAVATVPEPDAPPPQAIRSLQQQAFDFADAIGFPLRQGRVTIRDALGIYKGVSGVVRVKEVPDFEVVAHEAGHAIEAKVGPNLTLLTDRYVYELGPLDYDPTQSRANEGFAEYIRRMIGNPAHAQQVAPGFDAAFRDFMAQTAPDVLAAIERTSAAYRAYLDASSVKVTAARVRFADEEAGFAKAVAKVREIGIPGTIRTVMAHAYDALFDQNAPMARAVRELGAEIKKATGRAVDLKAADNPEILLRLFARTEQAAVRDMLDGVRPYRGIAPEGPSLSQAMRVATGQQSSFGKWDETLRREFSTYLIDRRSVILWDRFNRGDLPNPPDSVSRADAVVALAERERTNPQFRQAADIVHAYTRDLLKKAYEGHLIGGELYEKLLKEEFYVPFYRDLSDRMDGDSARPGARDKTADVVHRLKGSSRDIKDPIESIMMQTFLVNRAVRQNDIVLALEGLALKAKGEGGKFFEKLPAHEARKYTFDLGAVIERKALENGIPPDDVKVLLGGLTDLFGEDPLVGSFFKMEPAGKRGEPLIFYKRGGEMQVARVASKDEGFAIYELLTSLPSGLADLGAQVLSASSGILRAGITTNPVYALTNYIRDQIATALLRNDYIPFVSGAKGLVSEVRQGEAAQLYGYAGGVSAGAAVAPLQQASAKDQRNFVTRLLSHRQQTAPDVDALKKTGYLAGKFDSLHGFLEFVSIAEAGTRNSVFDIVYKEKRRQGLSQHEAMIEAAYAGDDIMPFGRWGSRTQAVRALTPFVNSWAQGMDKMRRTVIEPLMREAIFETDIEAKRNAVQSLVKIAGVGAVLGAAWAALHHEDESYQDARPELKGTHFVTSFGNKLFVMPKPFELSLGFTAGEFAYQRLMRDDPRAAAQFAEAAYEVLMPPTPIFANPMIKTSFELALNRSTFTKRDIVPDRLQRLPPEQQKTDRTSPIAKHIGAATGLSPIKVDYALGGYFGLWGRDAVALSAAIDPGTPTQNLEDLVFARRFIKDPTRSSDVTTKFWDFMGQTTGKYNQAVNGYDALVKGFREGEARDFLDKLPAAERAFVVMKSAAGEDGKAAFGADEKRLHPLQRAYDAVTVLNGLRGEMSENSFKTFQDQLKVALTPAQRGKLLDHVRELAQKEMRNAFVVMKEPGYANRALLELEPTMAKIRAVSPEVADEIATRYATAKIYTTQSVAKSYETMKSALNRFGSDADLGDLVDAAQGGGFEFGGERVKRPRKRRVPIPALN